MPWLFPWQHCCVFGREQTIVRVLAAVYLVEPLHWSTPWHNLHLQRSGPLITRTIVHRAPAAVHTAAVLQSGYKEIFFNLVVDMDAIIAYSIYILIKKEKKMNIIQETVELEKIKAETAKSMSNLLSSSKISLVNFSGFGLKFLNRDLRYMTLFSIFI